MLQITPYQLSFIIHTAKKRENKFVLFSKIRSFFSQNEHFFRRFNSPIWEKIAHLGKRFLIMEKRTDFFQNCLTIYNPLVRSSLEWSLENKHLCIFSSMGAAMSWCICFSWKTTPNGCILDKTNASAQWFCHTFYVIA